MTKHLLLFFILFTFGCATHTSAQIPYISHISPTAGFAGDTIFISGLNFTGITSVKFGGGEAVFFDQVTENLIKAVIPVSATFDAIIVSNSQGKSYSSQKFNLAFSGKAIALEVLKDSLEKSPPFLLPATGQQTQDLCLCDFDGDGKVDIAVTNAEEGSNVIDIYRNTSTIDKLMFDRTTLETKSPTSNLMCGDLNNDNKLDLIATEIQGDADDEIFIFENTSIGETISFIAKTSITLPTENMFFIAPAKVFIKDINLDGIPEIIATAAGQNQIHIFKNNALTSISFDSQPVLTLMPSLSDGRSVSGLEVQDLNQDNRPDIIVTLASNAGLYVFENNSTINNFSFEKAKKFDSHSNIIRIKSGDLDQDGFPDLVLTNNDPNGGYGIFLNRTTGTGAAINFADREHIEAGVSRGWGIDIGDIDGDGIHDLIFGATAIADNALYISRLTSSSSITNSTVETTPIKLTENSKNIKFADMDGDGKSDIVYVHHSLSKIIGAVGIFLNKTCINPSISPQDYQICVGGSVELTVSSSNLLKYEWRKDDVLIAGASQNKYTATTPGSYTVKVLDNCGTRSSAITVTQNGALFTPPTFDPPPAICADGEVTLNLTDKSPGESYTYTWTGPNGFTSTDKEPKLTNPKGGSYSVVITSSDGCIAPIQTHNLSVIQVPSIAIRNDENDEYCADGVSRITLKRSDWGDNLYTYAWLDATDKEVGTKLSFSPPATTTAGTASYSAKITTTDNPKCSYQTPVKSIQALLPPVAHFSAVNTKCQGVDITFTATKTGEEGFDVSYDWTFGDGATATGITNMHKFANTTGSPYTVTLKVDYTTVDNCVTTPFSKKITITAPPTGDGLKIIRSNNSDILNFEKCPTGTVNLTLINTYPSVLWKSKKTMGDMFMDLGTDSTQPISDTLIVVAYLTDANECTFTTQEVKVTNYLNSGFAITTDANNAITKDDTQSKILFLKENQTSVNLTIDPTIVDILWSPAEYLLNLENSTSNSITYFPNSTRNLVRVKGKDTKNCVESDSVIIVNNFIQVDKAFTPNGDGIGDCWEVSNANNIDFTKCTITIFDGKGRNIIQKTSPFTDDCVWDGISDGGVTMPDGVYYFTMNCDNTETSGSIKGQLKNSGSILLVR